MFFILNLGSIIVLLLFYRYSTIFTKIIFVAEYKIAIIPKNVAIP